MKQDKHLKHKWLREVLADILAIQKQYPDADYSRVIAKARALVEASAAKIGPIPARK